MLIPTAASEENSSLGIPNGVHISKQSALCCKDMNICKSILTFINRAYMLFYLTPFGDTDGETTP